MIVCSHCGLEAQMNDRFCKGCGHRFSVTDGDYSAGRFGSGTGYSSGRSGSLSAPWAASGSLGTGLSSVSSMPTITGMAETHGATSTAGSASTEGGSSTQVSVATSEAERATEANLGRLIVRAVTSEPGDEREYLLDGQSITVGRSPSCDIVFEGDQLISRRHALFKHDGERYLLVDLGSSNGTFINDTEIHEAVPLRNGDRVLIGEHELTYSTEPASPSATPTGSHARSAFTVVPPPRTDPHLKALGSQLGESTVGEEPTTPAAAQDDIESEPTIFIPSPSPSGAVTTELATSDSSEAGADSAFATPETQTPTTSDLSQSPQRSADTAPIAESAVEVDATPSQPFAITSAAAAPATPASTFTEGMPEEHQPTLDAYYAPAEPTPELTAATAQASDPWDTFNPDNLPATYADTSATETPDAAPSYTSYASYISAASLIDAPGTTLSTTPAPISAPPSMPQPGDSLVDHISAIQDYTTRLRQRTEGAEQLAAQRQQALAEARERVGAILREQQRYAAPVDDGEDLTPLIEVARQAAENPRHLDAVTPFADRAEDIVNALERRQAQRTAPTEAQRALEDLYAWLNRQG